MFEHPASARLAAETDPEETIRRGLGFLAFRLTDAGLVASFQPGATVAPVLVARAALAAVVADANLAAGGIRAFSTPAQAALQAREALIEQLAALRAHRPDAVRVACRERYLATLADLLIAERRESSTPAAERVRTPHLVRREIAARRGGF